MSKYLSMNKKKMIDEIKEYQKMLREVLDLYIELQEIYLNENGIQSRKFFAPMIDQPFLLDCNVTQSEDLINSTSIANSGLYLPTYIGITDKEIDFICKKIESFLENKV